MGDINNEVDAADETASSDETTAPASVLVLASASDSGTFGIKMVEPATAVELDIRDI